MNIASWFTALNLGKSSSPGNCCELSSTWETVAVASLRAAHQLLHRPAFQLILWSFFPKFQMQTFHFDPGSWEQQTQHCWSLRSLVACASLYIWKIISDLFLFEFIRTSWSSVGNKLCQAESSSAAPTSGISTDEPFQHRQVQSFCIWQKELKATRKAWLVGSFTCKGDIRFLLLLCRVASEVEAGKEVSNSYRLSWPEHKHLTQPDAGVAAVIGSRHSQVQVTMQRHAKCQFLKTLQWNCHRVFKMRTGKRFHVRLG